MLLFPPVCLGHVIEEESELHLHPKCGPQAQDILCFAGVGLQKGDSAMPFICPLNYLLQWCLCETYELLGTTDINHYLQRLMKKHHGQIIIYCIGKGSKHLHIQMNLVHVSISIST